MVKMRLVVAAMTIGCVLAMGSPLDAQRRGRNNSPAFERSSPAVGDLLPEVTAYDADGKPFSLRSIKDNYSVIVFGCLT